MLHNPPPEKPGLPKQSPNIPGTDPADPPHTPEHDPQPPTIGDPTPPPLENPGVPLPPEESPEPEKDELSQAYRKPAIMPYNTHHTPCMFQ